MNEQILIVESDQDTANKVIAGLVQSGYQVHHLNNGMDALEYLNDHEVDLLILDLKLDGLNGYELLRRLCDSKQHLSYPIMVLTAQDTTKDIVYAFDCGANDYLIKPFQMAELKVRVRNLLAIFGRNRGNNENVIRVGDIVIEPKRKQAKRDGELINLTPKEYELLLCLASHANQVCTRELILQEVWGVDFQINTNVVDVYIRHLRQKIDKGRPVKLITTVRGIGYMLQEP
ncbi:response regulator transcription factor [Paenibacillus sediminis]|uniref:DNA-binding response OmpR family regulator n=1 Tax=Paenibacillus sediminis TaxID=664909 RepID=A0ABS4H077_9BACL|nr:DNA-binding response OmpR family regulator [Paenibacillus sediminis]